MTVTGDLIAAYNAGTIPRDDFVAQMAGRTYATPSRFEPGQRPSGDAGALKVENHRHDEPDTWDEVVRAKNRGVLDADVYAQISRAIDARLGVK